jgi:hypothetical protein
MGSSQRRAERAIDSSPTHEPDPDNAGGGRLSHDKPPTTGRLFILHQYPEWNTWNRRLRLFCEGSCVLSFLRMEIRPIARPSHG